MEMPPLMTGAGRVAPQGVTHYTFWVVTNLLPGHQPVKIGASYIDIALKLPYSEGAGKSQPESVR